MAWLDEHFDALGEPVAQHGGEVLKFLGDGFLAVFPVIDPDERPCSTCNDAVAAAMQALERNRALNERRRATAAPELEADVVLHYGTVVYRYRPRGERGQPDRSPVRGDGPVAPALRRLRGALRPPLGRGRHLSAARRRSASAGLDPGSGRVRSGLIGPGFPGQQLPLAGHAPAIAR